MREFYKKGNIALTIENNTATVRFLSNPETDEFVAVCTLTEMTEDVVRISAMMGTLSRPYMRLLAHVLVEKGYKVAYARRLDSRANTLPFAEEVVGGDFDGWLRIDFDSIVKKGE